jgi:hypothetical protein
MAEYLTEKKGGEYGECMAIPRNPSGSREEKNHSSI